MTHTIELVIEPINIKLRAEYTVDKVKETVFYGDSWHLEPAYIVDMGNVYKVDDYTYSEIHHHNNSGVALRKLEDLDISDQIEAMGLYDIIESYIYDNVELDEICE